MKESFVILVAVLLLAVSPLRAQEGKVVLLQGSFLEQLQPRDSVLVADQLRYGVHLKDVAEGTGFQLPDYSKGLRDSVEVLSPWQVDTVAVHGPRKGPKSYDLDASVVIAAFDEGFYPLPPVVMLRRAPDGPPDTLVFNPLVLDVKTMPVDTTTFQPHDIKAQIRYPLRPAELLPYAAAAWVLAILAILAWALLSRRGKTAGEVPADPPHVVALRKLDHYRGERYWAPERQKVFYSGITDALREYMAARYGFDAMEMTTGEIFSALSPDDVPEDLYDRMLALFRTADLVKFAKARATDEENAAALPSAVRFVTATYQDQLTREGKGGEA